MYVDCFTVTTRSVYEKKLLKMLCGEEVQTPNKYEPVPDDESDEGDVTVLSFLTIM